MVRSEAANMAAAAGCNVGDVVGKATTILVVGDTDIRKLAGHDKNSKHRKAEALFMKGQPIRILCERDFLALLRIGS
jgi:DNA polymerase-3 subunit epsilon